MLKLYFKMLCVLVYCKRMLVHGWAPLETASKGPARAPFESVDRGGKLVPQVVCICLLCIAIIGRMI